MRQNVVKCRTTEPEGLVIFQRGPKPGHLSLFRVPGIMLLALNSEIALVLIDIARPRMKRDSRINNAYLSTDLTKPFYKGEHIRHVEMIQEPQAHYDVEAAIPLSSEVAHVILHELQIVK